MVRLIICACCCPICGFPLITWKIQLSILSEGNVISLILQIRKVIHKHSHILFGLLFCRMWWWWIEKEMNCLAILLLRHIFWLFAADATLDLFLLINILIIFQVREIVSILDLDVLFYPCPRNGPNFRPKVLQMGGKQQFPFMVW